MFNMFRSNNSIIRENYVNSQNLFYTQSGYKAHACTYDKVFKVTWDLWFTADLNGLNYEDLKANLKESQSFFPDSQGDRALKEILLDKGFDTYELCYKCLAGETITVHKTYLLNNKTKNSRSNQKQLKLSDNETKEIKQGVKKVRIFGWVFFCIGVLILLNYDWNEYKDFSSDGIGIAISILFFSWSIGMFYIAVKHREL